MHHKATFSLCCFSVEDDLTVKITDFSLAQDFNATSLSDKGIQSRLLIKWTAPEGLKHRHFTEKSDVVCGFCCCFG